MREKGERSDGYYYQSATSIIGARTTKEEACQLLQKAAALLHPDEKPFSGTYDTYGDTEMVFHLFEDLVDKLWVETVDIGSVYDRINQDVAEH